MHWKSISEAMCSDKLCQEPRVYRSDRFLTYSKMASVGRCLNVAFKVGLDLKTCHSLVIHYRRLPRCGADLNRRRDFQLPFDEKATCFEVAMLSKPRSAIEV